MVNYKSYYESPDLGKVYYPVGHYLEENLNLAREMGRILNTIYPREDLVLVCSGSSGTILTGMLATICRVERIMYVCKDNERRHSSGKIDPTLTKGKKVIILDDFMSSGETVKRIYKKIVDDGNTVDCLCLGGEIYLDGFEDKDYKIETLIAHEINDISETGKETKICLSEVGRIAGKIPVPNS